MSTALIKFLIGYFMVLNLFAIILMCLKVKTDFIKTDVKKLDVIFLIVSMLGGFVGVLVGSEMLGYQKDIKLYKKTIPWIIFLEVCIIATIVYYKM